jgi:hypothetical protein
LKAFETKLTAESSRNSQNFKSKKVPFRNAYCFKFSVPKVSAFLLFSQSKKSLVNKEKFQLVKKCRFFRNSGNAILQSVTVMKLERWLQTVFRICAFKDPMFEVYVIRHGQSEANKAKIHQGNGYDTDLTEEGRLQAATLKSALPADPTKIIASPLKRAHQTCQIATGADAQKLDKRFMERSLGQLEGLSQERVKEIVVEVFNPK